MHNQFPDTHLIARSVPDAGGPENQGQKLSSSYH
jgi:hypothetical protein